MHSGHNLDQQFIDEPPREISGSRSANRFDFQLSYAFSELLRLHELGQSFLMVFDFHEDLVVFDSEDQPQGADFIQVKSRNILSNWTLGGLLSAKKGQKAETDSILGKLFENHRKFSHSTQLVFLSNRGLSAKLANGEKAQNFNRVSFEDLSKDARKVISEKLGAMGPAHPDCEGLKKLQFKKTTLDVDGHTTMIKGLLADFYQRCHPNSAAPIALIYDCISGELRSRNNQEGQYLSFTELRKQKAVGSAEFSQMISAPLGYESSSARWEGIERTLQTNGYSYSHCRQLKHAWESFIIESMDYSNDLLTSLKQKVADSVRNYEANNSDYTMISLIDTVANELRIDFSKRHMADYIQVAIVNYLCSNHEQLPEINTESPK